MDYEVQYEVVSSDNVSFWMTEKALSQSVTLSTCAENLCISGDNPRANVPIPLMSINSSTLRRVVAYCETHKNDVRDDSRVIRPNDAPMCESDAELVNGLSSEELFDLISAANYLDIKGLLMVSCKAVARLARVNHPEDIRYIFEIPFDQDQDI